MKKYFQILLLISVFLLSSCEKSYWSGLNESYDSFPDNPVSPQQAVKLAQPYLDKTFRLRSNMAQRLSNGKLSDIVTLEGDYYYIVRDNFASYSPDFYRKHAVKVNKKTGKVIPPK